MRIFSSVAHHAGKAGAEFLLIFMQKPCTRITQKQHESGFQPILCDSVRFIYYIERTSEKQDAAKQIKTGKTAVMRTIPAAWNRMGIRAPLWIVKTGSAGFDFRIDRWYT